MFRISGGECHPLQKFRYKHRCDLPPPINVAAATDASGEIIPSPTFGGTVKPTQNVFGLGAAGGKNSFIRRQRGATFEADTSYDDVLQVAQVVEQDQDQNQEHERKEFFAAGDDAVLDDDQKNNNGGENQRQQLEGLGAGSDDAEEEDEEEKEEEGDEGDQPPLTGFELLSELLKSKRPSQAPTATPSQQAAGEGKGGTAAEEVAQQATQAAAALKHLHRTPMELAESIGDVDSVRAYRAARQRLEPQF